MKIILYTALAILLAIVLFIVLSLFGNPISKIMAEKAADQYLETHHRDLDLVHERAYYNFKDGTYVVSLWDMKSIDTKFNLEFDSFGKMKRDTFDDRLFNTLRRYMGFLDDLADEIAKDSGLDFVIWLRPDDDFDYREYLTLDQDFDKDNLPSKITAGFKAYAEKPSLDDLMNGLKKVYEVLKERNIAVKSYSGLVIPNDDKKEDGEAETWKNAISVNDVPEKVIVDGELDELKRIYDKGNKILNK
ncbi:hypothetical protein [Fenollaria massiliensis]|uniref:YfjL-like N-terminal domain-containing protein n=1 Tax=Fenollaria massiliensis TaxID=938288 RepID=A0A9E7DJI8_9FIRM|nr:hypothetical protein [Fenollaria massiliensis]UQK59105.1 hypothetical protein M1R53_00085 [Fenollaria massiliensis]